VLRLLRKERDDNGVAANAEHAVGRAASSSGEPLPADTQARFEGSLGADLSSVRVHRSADSAAAADAVSARAYTTGQDIHFGAGQYAPQDPFGMHLLAHEVAHTVQQSSGAAREAQFKLEVSTPGDALEVEADRAADAMVDGRAAPIASASGAAIQRDPAPPPQQPFRSPAVQAVVDAESGPPSAAQRSGLGWLDGGASGPWTKVAWGDVQTGTARRIFHPDLIDQKNLGLCGPAGVLNGVAANEPLRYAMDVREVFRDGKYGSHKQVNKDLLGRDIGSGLDASDWIMLTAMQDTSNDFSSYKGEPGKHDGSTWGDVTDWLKDIAGARRVESYTWDIDGILKINSLLRAFPQDVIVIAQVRAEDLPGQEKKDAIIENHDHIIRIVGPITGYPTAPKVPAFTWGANQTFEFPDWKAYKKCFYTFKVGTHNDAVPL
jgi:hypothetical protein